MPEPRSPSFLQNPTVAFTGPFVLYVGLLAVERSTGLSAEFLLAFRFAVVALAIGLLSRPYLTLKVLYPLAAVLIGVAVFLLWVGPDVLFGYRHHWLFENSLTGAAKGTLSPDLRQSSAFLTLRIATSVLLVPIVEELFWRGWLMRWLIAREWTKVPLGTYQTGAFWIVALLFASEHGPYWEVGLLAGVVYNWWMVRAKSLMDCIVAHAVTNGVLAVYVVGAGQWQYWL